MTTTTSHLQACPDVWSSPEDYRANHRETQTNARYASFRQTHFTAGDAEQFELYRDKTNGRICTPSISLMENRYARLAAEHDTDMVENTSLPIYRGLTTSSVDHTFSYIFFKLKKGCFIKVKDGRLAVFLPFSNAAFVNEWGHLMKHDPRYPGMYEMLADVAKRAGHVLHPKKVNANPSTWYANNCLVRTEWPLHEGDSDLSNLRDMFITLCEQRAVPDLELFLNKRDFPLLKRDHTEPYDAIFGRDTPLLSHRYDRYCPILSMVTTDEHSDVPIPTWEDWQRVRNQEDSVYFPSCRAYSDDFSKPWSDRKPVAVFRGASTGMGTTPETNPRLRLALMSRERPDLLDAGITKWNLRPRKEEGVPHLTTIHYERYNLALVPPLTPAEQAAHKYIVNVDGHVSAFRLSYELASGSVVLLQQSRYRMWFSRYLVPFVHYVPVAADLSDLIEKIEWCRSHDEECRQIADAAREFYRTYLCKDAVLDYLQAALVSLKETVGTYVYSVYPPQESLAERELALLRERMDASTGLLPPEVRIPSYFDKGSWSVHRAVEAMLGRVFREDRLSDYMGSLDMEAPLYQGTNVVIYRTAIFGSDWFIAKYLRNDQKTREFMHDAFVGQMAVNQVLRRCPNFVYTYGVTREGLLLREHVEGQTLADYIRGPDFTYDKYYSLLLQCVLALRVAQEEVGFVHHDTLPWNILLEKKKYPVWIEYRVADSVYRICTATVVRFIDYGKSHAVVGGVHHGHSMPFAMPSFSDMITLVLGSLYEVVSRKDQIPSGEAAALLGLANHFTKSDIRRTQVDTLSDLRTWLRTARKYSNLTQYASLPIAMADPAPLLRFLHRLCTAHPAGPALTIRPTSGAARAYLSVLEGATPEDAACAALQADALPSPTTRLQYLVRRYAIDTVLHSVETFAKAAEVMGSPRVQAELMLFGTLRGVGLDAPMKHLMYNRYRYPHTPLPTPYTENTFSDPEALYIMSNVMSSYVMPDYLSAREMLLDVLTSPYHRPAREEEQYYREQGAVLVKMNAFAVRHELADKATFWYLVSTCTHRDLEHIRSAEDADGDVEMQAAVYAYLLNGCRE